jgi:hypothetical protein
MASSPSRSGVKARLNLGLTFAILMKMSILTGMGKDTNGPGKMTAMLMLAGTEARPPALPGK